MALATDEVRYVGDGVATANLAGRTIADLIAASGYDDGRVRIDTSVVRGLEYYTGPVYEVELLLETKDEKGRPVRFGSVSRTTKRFTNSSKRAPKAW